MRRNPITYAAALLAVLFTASPCVAQETEVQFSENQSPERPARPIGQPAEQTIDLEKVNLNLVDQKLALSLAVDTQGQLEMLDYALKSASHEGLRRLLSDRRADQQAFAAVLNQLTHNRAEEAIDRARQDIAADKLPDRQPQRLNLLALRRNATAMVVRIRLEQLQEYTQMLCCELNATSSTHFDRDYLRCEMLHQMQILAMLKVFEGQASADFAQVIRQASVDCADYLTRAKQTLLQIETAPLADTTPVAAAVVEGTGGGQ